MMCAMCGKEDRLVVARIEGTELKVCNSCARYGKVIKQVAPPVTPKQAAREEKRVRQIIEKPVEMVVTDYASIIRNKRERNGLKQSEFAKKLNEKESVIQLLEQGRITPSLELARKLERFLHIKLIEEYEEKKTKMTKSTDEDLTLGDLIKIKKR